MCNKNCAIAAILSVVVGIIIGGLFSAGLITAITTGIIVALIFAAATLLYLAIILSINNREKCICNNGVCAVIGAIGTIITGVVGLSLTLTATFLGILLVGLIGFFFALTLISIFLLFICLIKSKCVNNCCKYYNESYEDYNKC